MAPARAEATRVAAQALYALFSRGRSARPDTYSLDRGGSGPHRAVSRSRLNAAPINNPTLRRPDDSPVVITGSFTC
jgi:hypothetical protein